MYEVVKTVYTSGYIVAVLFLFPSLWLFVVYIQRLCNPYTERFSSCTLFLSSGSIVNR